MGPSLSPEVDGAAHGVRVPRPLPLSTAGARPGPFNFFRPGAGLSG